MSGWTEAPHGIIEGAEQRFWSGLGEYAEPVARRMINDPSFLDWLILQAKNGGKVETVVPKPKPPLFSLAATFPLGAVASKKTKECFTGSRFAYRDKTFDTSLAADQSAAEACLIVVLTPSQNWTFAEAAAFVLDMPKNTPIDCLAALLKEHSHTMTLAQAEEMVEATERGDKTEVRTDGYANFYFVENVDGSVSVAYVDRVERWSANVDRLVSGDRWNADNRLLVRNLDATKLGP